MVLIAFPSTFLDIQDEVIGELRLEDADRGLVKDLINRAYARGAIETEALELASTAPMTANESTYTLPTPVVRIKLLKVAAAGSPTAFGKPLRPVSLQELVRRQAGDPVLDPTGATQVYAVVGEDEIVVWPTPGAADLMFFWYVRMPVPLSADGDTLELQEPYGTDICKYGACMEAAAKATGFANQDYRQLFRSAILDYRVHLSRRRGLGTLQFDVIGGLHVPVSNDADNGR